MISHLWNLIVGKPRKKSKGALWQPIETLQMNGELTWFREYSLYILPAHREALAFLNKQPKLWSPYIRGEPAPPHPLMTKCGNIKCKRT